jgi:hypothetical protein
MSLPFFGAPLLPCVLVVLPPLSLTSPFSSVSVLCVCSSLRLAGGRGPLLLQWLLAFCVRALATKLKVTFGQEFKAARHAATQVHTHTTFLPKLSCAVVPRLVSPNDLVSLCLCLTRWVRRWCWVTVRSS